MKAKFIWSHFFSGFLGAIFGCLVGSITVYFVALRGPVAQRVSSDNPQKIYSLTESEAEVKEAVQLKDSNLFMVACAKEIKNFCEKLKKKPEVLRECLTDVKSKLSKSCQQFI